MATLSKKKLKELATAVGVAVLATVLAAAATKYLTFLSSLENIAADIRIAALQPPMPQSKDIVIAGITEETVTQFPYRSPVDRAFLAKLLKTLEKKGAKAIGVDVLFDQPTEPDKDALLKQTIRELKTPLFISYTNTPTIVNEDQLAFLNDFVPEAHRAGANLVTDPFDGTVRWTFAGETNPGMPLGFPRKAAQLVGVETPKANEEIAWRPQADAETPAFPVYPSHALAVMPDDWVKGKIVLVGAVLSITDRHRTPMAVVYDDDRGMMPGIEVQAHGLSQLLEHRQHPRLAYEWAIALTAVFALLGMAIGLFKKGIAFNVVVGIVLIAGWWVGSMLGFTYGFPLVPLVSPTLGLALSLWMMDTLIGGAERKQRQFVQGAFSRYVSPDVVNQLVDNPEALQVKGDRHEVSFIFTDVAGFTTLSEGLTAEKLSDTLNAYLDGACQIILDKKGTIDKFIGDAIMTLFNAPLPQPDHAERAVRCALAIDAYAEDFRKRYNADGIPIGVTRIGIHCGPAVVGNFGSHQRMDFTALGDTVNTAARCEGVNKYFGTRICATQPIVDQCTTVRFRPIGDVVLKGKTEAVTLYNPVTDEFAASPAYADYMATYALLKAEDAKAADAVRALKQAYPDDPLIDFHLDRVESGLCTARVVMEDK
ncbi:MAG: adenylate/guanylate cyclase domain-containing protein [Rhodocyclaceae bacterium]|nr:adenylate/guanylate cyclase domain-containing protein [Rhodocyclaceae bacterium]